MIVCETKINSHKSANEIWIAIFGENGAKPSVDTVKHRLREAGLYREISQKKTLLSERKRKKRIEFTKKKKIMPLLHCGMEKSVIFGQNKN